MWMLLSTAAIAATPFFGVEYTPFGRGDLVWVTDQRTSGNGVGEFDGVVAANLSAYFGGWFTERFGMSGSLGIARLQNTTWVEETFRQRHWGVVRPAIDFRFGLSDREVKAAHPWLLFGSYGDIPSSRDTSNGYSPEEQEAADLAATDDRARLGGFGFRWGFGADYRLNDVVAIGALYTWSWHRSVLEADDATAVTSWLQSDVALMVTFAWPGKPKSDPPEETDPGASEAADPPR